MIKIILFLSILIVVVIIISLYIIYKFIEKYMFTIYYNKYRDIILQKFEEAYAISRRKDLVVYLNDPSGMTSDVFKEFAANFINNYKTVCGNRLYKKIISTYDTESDFISYILILADEKISNDKMLELNGRMLELDTELEEEEENKNKEDE